MTFMFDDDAMKRSEAAVLEQLPKMIYAANRNGSGLLVEALFAGNCNDTPVTSDIMAGQLLLLRDEGELYIMGKDGSPKPRSRSVDLGGSARIAAGTFLVQPPQFISVLRHAAGHSLFALLP